MHSPIGKHDKFAVITGASSGIGRELATQFAEHGYDLLIASSSEKIREAHVELARSGALVTALEVDLAAPGGVHKLHRKIQEIGRPVDALAVNAGVGVGGDFVRDTLWEDEERLIQLNVISMAHITKLVAKDMVARGSGRILITSSIAATVPATFEAIYGASKAFGLMFAEAIRNELKDTGVTVTALMPGPTDTNFFHRAGLDDTKVGIVGKHDNNPADVARQGFEALMAGKDHVLAASFKTKLQGFLARFLPEPTKAELHRRMAEPVSSRAAQSA